MIGGYTKERFKNPVIRERHHQGLIRSGVGQRLGAWVKEHYGDPVFVKKMMAGLNMRPNKLELRVTKVLRQYYPREWQYTGNGEVIIGALVPDFTNINGRKALIEVFGDYWHKRGRSRKPSYVQTEYGRKEYYSRYGFSCLVLWESFLNNASDAEVAQKVGQFFGD